MRNRQDISTAKAPADDAFQREREHVVQLIDRLWAVALSLKTDANDSSLKFVRERVRSDDFRVLVFGEFGRGKSTLINALLGEKILAARTLPTPLINLVKWSDTPQAFVYTGNQQDASRREIKFAEVANYVGVKGTPELERVEILYPFELGRHRAEFVEVPFDDFSLAPDSPAAANIRDLVAQADAILFVMSCVMLGSASEMKAIEELLRPLGHNDLFFVCNHFDRLDEQERERIREHALSLLAPLTTGGAERIFFTSAQEALSARKTQDAEAYAASGVELLETTLEKHLSRHRGRAKMQRVAAQCNSLIRLCRSALAENSQPDNSKESRAHVVESKAEANGHEARRAERLRASIAGKFSKFQQGTAELLTDLTTNFLLEAADKIERGLAAEEVKGLTALGVLLRPVSSTAQEMARAEGQRLNECFAEWEQTVLHPALFEQAARFEAEISEELAMLNAPSNSLSSEISKLFNFERNLSFLRQSLEQRSKGLRVKLDLAMPALLVALSLSAIGVFLYRFTSSRPLTLIFLLLFAALVTGYFLCSLAYNNLRREVGRTVAEIIRAESAQQARLLADQFLARMKESELEAIQDSSGESSASLSERGAQRETQNGSAFNRKDVADELEALSKELKDIVESVGRG